MTSYLRLKGVSAVSEMDCHNLTSSFTSLIADLFLEDGREPDGDFFDLRSLLLTCIDCLGLDLFLAVSELFFKTIVLRFDFIFSRISIFYGTATLPGRAYYAFTAASNIISSSLPLSTS